MTFWYRLCWWICRIGLFFWHPVLHVHGRELVPAGCALLCANHSGMADPIWIMLALNSPKMIRILAKEELRRVPFLGWVMERFDIIFVRRGAHQPEVYEKSTEALRAGDKLLVFVEGTRCNGDKHVRAKTGACAYGARERRAGRAGVCDAEPDAVLSGWTSISARHTKSRTFRRATTQPATRRRTRCWRRYTS